MDTRTDSVKTASKNVIHKSDEFLGNSILDAVAKTKDDKIMKPDENPRNVEEIITPLEKRDEILDKLRKVLYKWNTIKYLGH